MAMNPPACAETLRNCIRKLHLPRPLNIFLFGFDNDAWEDDDIPSVGPSVPEIPEAVPDTPPKRRGPKPGTPIDYDDIGLRLEEWCVSRKEFPAEISTDQLAEEIGARKSHLLKYFSHHLKKDIRLWKLEQKIACAQRILRKYPAMPVSDVAFRCGFNNASNFFRQFKRIAGCTPLDWRNDD